MTDPHAPCAGCTEEYPEGVLEDGFCPSCVDDFCAICSAPLDEAGDGYDGLCGSCADQQENEHGQE